MQIVDCILCEDIRYEMGNLKSLMGVFDDSIEFLVTPDNEKTWPKKRKLGLYMKILLDDNECDNMSSFKLFYTYLGEDHLIGEGKASVDNAEPTKVILISAMSVYSFKDQGELGFKIVFFDKDGNVKCEEKPRYILEIKEQIKE